MTSTWQPTASIKTLKQRAAIIQQIRQFFYERKVMEVETPLLASAGVTDLYLENLITEFQGPGFATPKELYLQTSPEFAMKRLLAAGSGCIFQICKAARDDESGRYHNPEFSILEWYRIGFNHFDLIDEIDQLLQLVLSCEKAERYSYQAVFQQHLGIDPLTASAQELKLALMSQGEADLANMSDNKTDLLQFILSQCIEPKIGQSRPCVIYNFPAEQASLAKISKQDNRVAERFEIYYKGIELANGFHELTDSNEQAKRFEQDNKARVEAGKKPKPIDYNLLAALSAGLPDCAGVALGIDRLVMLALNKPHIDQVLSFNIHNC
ncbi:elongation factor P--(R)-beta-lysine ligase [Catenovulum maritimum]|uniref:PoxB regulator PoxA n=1 Tax=Catenovulum maritimum TaxID=1513271 RepID=A0A0J8GY71_9ALTE|nr:elongation factor P--(R)-beta-lysine ligase [Catenovulum maritimum]KMT65678.1 poxB regulator PoxA [Catenovulum maritimum]